MLQASYQVVKDNNEDIVESNISDWKTFDVLTFLLKIMYLSSINSKVKLQKMIKEFFEEYKGDIADENVQNLLMYMYKEKMLSKMDALNLLKGTYKKLVDIDAPLNIEFASKIKFDEDKSKILSSGESLRSVLRNKLGI
jgi:hypothetical protein